MCSSGVEPTVLELLHRCAHTLLKQTAAATRSYHGNKIILWQQDHGCKVRCCTGKLISDLGSATWKHRNAAVEQVEGIIKAAGNRIQTSTGGLLPALKVCLHT